MSFLRPANWSIQSQRFFVGTCFALFLTAVGLFGWKYWEKTKTQSLLNELSRGDSLLIVYQRRPKFLSLFNESPERPAYEVHVNSSLTIEPLLRVVEIVEQLPATVNLVINDCPALTSLDVLRGAENIYGLRFIGQKELTDLSVLATCPNLRSLAVYGCPNVTDWEFLRTLPDLEEQTIAHCGELQDIEVLAGFSKLKELYIHTPTNVSNLDFLAHYPDLQRLELGSDRIASDKTSPLVVAKLDNINGLTHCKQLTIIIMNACEMNAAPPSVPSLAAECVYWSMRNNTALTDVTFLIPGHRYIRLDFSGCTNLDDISSLKNCNVSETLNLRGATELSDISVLINNPAVLYDHASLHLEGTGVPREQIDALREIHPTVTIHSDYDAAE